MPRTRLDDLGKKHKAMKALLCGQIYQDGGTLETAAPKLGTSPATLSRRCRDPGKLTIDELLNFGRKYHIPIEELRAAIRY